jgi:O-antigen/teichoic acid export membrane protein
MMSGYFALALAVVVNVILVPTILSNLGKELYGLWFLVFNIISYFYLADFGITNAITRLYSKYRVFGQESVNKLLSSSYLLVFALDIFILLFLIAFKDGIAEFLGVERHNLEVFGVLFLIGCFELFSQFILRVNLGVLRGEHKYHIAYNLEALTSSMRILSLGVLVFTDSFTVTNFAILYSLSKVFSDSISVYFLRNTLKRLIPTIDYPVIKELIDNSGSTMITSICATIYNTLPMLLFGKIFGIDQVFLYSIPFAIMIMLSRLMNVMYAGFTPRAAELKAIKNEAEIKKISGYAVKIALFVGSLSLIFIMIFGFEIFEFWLGASGVLTLQELRIIHNIFILLLIFLTIANLQNANIVIYQAAGLHWYVTLETVISAILLLFLSFVFLDRFNVYSFAIAMIFVGTFKYLYYRFARASKFQTYSVSFFVLFVLALYMSSIYWISALLVAVLAKLVLSVLSGVLLGTFIYYRLFDVYEKAEIQTEFEKLKLKWLV